MKGPHLVAHESLGHKFIESPYLPDGKDEHYLRNGESPRPLDQWRKLEPHEIEALVHSNNSADDWNNIRVTDTFDPYLIRNCQFYGLVRIGKLQDKALEYHELLVPTGLTNSRILSCDFGDNVAIHGVRHLAHYIIGSNCVLLDIDEMHTSNHAKFGNGIVKEGEDESLQITLDLMNECGGRSVLPFDGMMTADAYIWARYREDEELMRRLREITQKQFDCRRGFYGTVGDRSVIKSCGVIKDVKIGDQAYIKGANKLKNLTINSSAQEPSQIGEGVELVNGIVGYGGRVFYGCKAVRFVMCDNTSLKYGARLIHSVLGDNSTVSCCEVLSNLVFPAHEQHHNNSFLIAALVKGQSNIGAGATIGSNHNSRAPDGEIHAGRGFWPGLCVSLKHNSTFASFCLIAKGSYQYELNVPLPFCLVSDDPGAGRLVMLPAYWWMYNMYALARNTWKFGARDGRKVKRQNIEFDSLAPDTVEEIFDALELLEIWTAQAELAKAGKSCDTKSPAELSDIGKELLSGSGETVNGLEILAEGVERSSRQVLVKKVHAAYRAYRQMLHYYAMKNLLAFIDGKGNTSLSEMIDLLAGDRQKRWVNLGGQLALEGDVDALRADIRSGRLETWSDIHRAYDRLWSQYPLAKQRHAFATLMTLLDGRELSGDIWRDSLDEAVEIQRYIADQTFLSRKKDEENPFRRASYDSPEQMAVILGTAEENSFVKQVRRETDEFAKLACKAKDFV